MNFVAGATSSAHMRELMGTTRRPDGGATMGWTVG
jgi:hypothetical protein